MSFSIKYKASIPVMLLATALVSFTALSIYYMKDVESTTGSLAQRHQELEQVQQIENAASELVFPHLHVLTHSDPHAQEKANALFARIEQKMKELERMQVVHDEERKLLDFVADHLQVAKTLSQKIFDYRGENHEQFMQLIHALSESHLIPIRNELSQWHVEEARDVQELNETAEQQLHDYMLGALVVLALAVGMVIFSLWFNHRLLIRPVLNIKRVTSRLATGDFQETTQVTSRDELGALASNINDMAVSLESMYRELNDQARTDRLTGIANRLSMEEILAKELASAQRNEHPLALAVFDLDHFKTVNDRYGHPVGDKVLQIVAQVVQRSIRQCDYFFRYGGEEFLLILPHTDAAMAAKVLERCRRAIETHKFIIDSYKIPVTASFGLAGFPEDGVAPETLVTNADEALYTAKNTGRNKIVDYTGVLGQKLRHQAS